MLKIFTIRLSNKLKSKIKINAEESFGEADLYLFGCRTDDSKKGGDIDLAIDINVSREDFRKRKSKFKAAMIRQGLDLKIDIVPFQTSDELLFNEVHINCILI